jgi:triosephosphate isomerase (TIM)
MTSPALIGVSLKMYFGFEQTLRWCDQVAALAQRHPAISAGTAELFVLPTAPAIASALRIFDGGPVAVGAQDLFWEPAGAFTGETGAPFLAEMGCRYAEVGHAERRRIFGESVQTISAKTAAAVTSGLVPVICVGETDLLPAEVAAKHCLDELTEILSGTTEPSEIVLAYEPVWAIGAAEPAAAEHISVVCQTISAGLRNAGAGAGSRVIYGGSAKPGLLGTLNGTVDGLFLGRFAHDPAALSQILDEVTS